MTKSYSEPAVPVDERPQSPPRSPTRVMAILETLAKEGSGLQLARLCERLDQPKTTLLSLLRALEEEQYVTNSQGVYQLGESALRLGALITSAFPFPASIRQHLSALCGETDESIQVAVVSTDGLWAVYVDKVEPNRPLRYTVDIGTRRPLFSTAIGRALLAHFSTEEMEHYLCTISRVDPDFSTIDLSKLKKQLDHVRKSGVSSAFEEYTEGVGAHAAGVFAKGQRIRAAVSVSGPVDRIRAASGQIETALIRAAQAMSKTLGAIGSMPEESRSTRDRDPPPKSRTRR